jgi:hypothetical protein
MCGNANSEVTARLGLVRIPHGGDIVDRAIWLVGQMWSLDG